MDEQLRREFQHAAAAPTRRFTADAIRRAVRRRRRRNRVAAAAAVLVVGASAAAAIGWGSGSGEETVVLDPDPGQESRDADGDDDRGDPAERGTDAGSARDGTVSVQAPRTLAVSAGFGVSVVEASSGTVLADRSQALSGRAVGFGDVTLSPDGATVYLNATINAYIREIHRVRADGTTEMVAEGADPAMSPDGDKLAYTQAAVNRARNPEAALKDELVVRDLTSGEERTWETAAVDDPGLRADVRSVSWDPQSQKLAFELVFEDGSEVRVLDTTQGESLLDSRELEAPDGTAYRLPTYRGRKGTLAVVRTRGGHDPDIDPQESTIAEVDPDTGEVVATLVDPAGMVRGLDFDATGEHLLFTVEPTDTERQTGPTRLFAWSGDEATRVPLEREPVAAAW